MNDKQIERAYQDAINAVDMMTAMLEDLRDSLKAINQQFETPVRKSDKQED